MVGFKKNDNIYTSDKLIAGAASGIVCRVITNPFDVVRLRRQLQPRRATDDDIHYKMWRREGLRVFYRGHLLGQIITVLSIGTTFPIFELAATFMERTKLSIKYDKDIVNFSCGAFAGVCSSILVLLLDVIRVRQMLTHSQYKGIIKGAKRVYRAGGFLAFYEGLGVTVLQVGLQMGITFGMFCNMQKALLSHAHDTEGKIGREQSARALALATPLAAAISGFVAKSAVYPLELIKKRMQIFSHQHEMKIDWSKPGQLMKCSALGQCVMYIWQHDGILGFFNGWGGSVSKAIINTTVAFSTYELVCRLIETYRSTI